MRDIGAHTVLERPGVTLPPREPLRPVGFLDPGRSHSRLRPEPSADLSSNTQPGLPCSTPYANRFSTTPTVLDDVPQAETRRADVDRFDAMQHQLIEAGAMQRNLLAPLPAIHGASVDRLQRPAGAVSGDISEVFRIDADHIGFAVLDACGHDLAAGMLALYAARLIRTTLADSVGDANGPGRTLQRLNEELCRANLDECRFVTAFVAVYDERTHTLRWARAGAPHPIIIGPDGEARLLVARGPLLGVIDDADFETAETRLDRGETLVVATDGLPDFLGRDFVEAIQGVGDRTQTTLRPSGPPLQERFIEWQEALSLSDAAGVERDDVTVLTLTASTEIAATNERSHTTPTRFDRRVDTAHAEPALCR